MQHEKKTLDIFRTFLLLENTLAPEVVQDGHVHLAEDSLLPALAVHSPAGRPTPL